MLQEFLIPQLDEDDQEGRIHVQQDGAPPHYLGEVREYLNTRFPGRWTGRAAPIAWPPRSPDLTPMDFFLWGFVKDRVFVPPLPANVAELRSCKSDARDATQTCGKRLTTGGRSATLPMEVTLNHNYPR